ncbi:zinc finger protein 717-like isoform X2 [Lepus europaeus]|uniref:zinc finger protein 717-like isoform X2 n=1 Tax=Lepus europaeus TaxID=9983 RepID=UPI002B4A8F11|nr:zinc finger protein 717-like isoform X2 [Lepus europaeus]
MLALLVVNHVMIAFEELVVYFTWEEWQNMNQAQKILYRDVMLETYSSLFSVGHCMTKPDLIFKLEQGAEPWMVGECLHKSLPATTSWSCKYLQVTSSETTESQPRPWPAVTLLEQYLLMKKHGPLTQLRVQELIKQKFNRKKRM